MTPSQWGPNTSALFKAGGKGDRMQTQGKLPFQTHQVSFLLWLFPRLKWNPNACLSSTEHASEFLPHKINAFTWPQMELNKGSAEKQLAMHRVSDQ